MNISFTESELKYLEEILFTSSFDSRDASDSRYGDLFDTISEKIEKAIVSIEANKTTTSN